MEKFFLISAGAVLGANLRYWVGDWAIKRFGTAFPMGTFIINISGSFLLGLFLSLAMDRLALDPRWKLLLGVGFLGAYTTFSTYTYESLALFQQGKIGLGLVNLLGSSLLGALAVGMGVLVGRGW